MRMQATARVLLHAVLCIILAGPDLAMARAGGGHSSGSRGSRTYQPSPSTAQPMQRSATPQPAPAPQQVPQAAPQQPYRQPPMYPQPASHPFLHGLAGGLAGMAIGHFLFGSHGMAMGVGGGAGEGTGGPGLIHFLLIGLVIWLAFRFFRSRGSMGGMGGGMSGGMGNGMGGNRSMPMFSESQQAVAPPTSQPIQLQTSDRDAFAQLFLDIQKAWSAGDFAHLQQYMTPEMLGYFNEELSANLSRGVTNKVENVQIQNIEAVESWHEYNLDYASVAIRWTASDHMVRIGGPATDASYGDSDRRQDQEQWTFVRSQGGRWLLSAIQQMS